MPNITAVQQNEVLHRAKQEKKQQHVLHTVLLDELEETICDIGAQTYIGRWQELPIFICFTAHVIDIFIYLFLCLFVCCVYGLTVKL